MSLDLLITLILRAGMTRQYVTTRNFAQWRASILSLVILLFLLVYSMWFAEQRAYRDDPYSRTNIMWLNNNGGHDESIDINEVLVSTKTELCFFTTRTKGSYSLRTHLWSLDKGREWIRLWEEENMMMIGTGYWSKGSTEAGHTLTRLTTPARDFP